MQNSTFVMTNIADYPDMGLRTVLTVRMPKVQHLFHTVYSGDSVDRGLGSNPGEDMDVCKCIVHKIVGGGVVEEGGDSWEASLTTSRVLSVKTKVELNKSYCHLCMMLKAKTNDNRTSSPLPR
ncbi:hypothetical protein TNCV_4818931 [Trichonephila clavipes]|nr:hypothetical protein TNCV_4818931 [Trichonephila clavipes]